MITSFRKLSKSWAAPIIIGLIVISFVIVGTTDLFSSRTSGPVLKAGDREVSQPEFRRLVDQQLANYREQTGQTATMQELVAQGGHVQLLNGLAQQEGFLSWIWKAGVRPGHDLIAQQIREFPVFFNQITGRFDQTQYASALAQQGVTEAQFERELQDQLASNHFGAAIFAGLRVPRVYGAVLAGQAMHTRDASWFTVTQAMAGEAEAPTDEQLTAFMSENAAQLRRPEFRAISLVVFSSAPDAAPPAITDEQIQERFEFRRESLSQPETRSFVTLTAPDAATATRIAQALRGGQSVEAVAEANDIEPATFDNRPRSAVTDAAVAAAAFGLEAGGVSDPVAGALGQTVVRVTSVTPGRAATLADARDEIVAELRREALLGETYNRVERFEQARADDAELAAAVEAADARVIDLPPFTQDGRLPNGQPLNAPEQVLRSAYALERGAESDVIDAGQGQYFVVRLNEITPAEMPALEDVRAVLAERWLARENARRLAARADELAARIRGGESLADVAQSVSVTVTARTGLEQNQQVQTEIGQGVMAGVFSQAQGQVFTGPQNATSFVIGQVDRIRTPVAALAAPRAEQVRPQLSMQLVEAMGQSAQTAAADQVGVETWPERALNALGVTAPAGVPAQEDTPEPAPAS